jgi:hypothetical protein
MAGTADKDEKGKGGPTPGGDAVYGLGVVGAWVFFWKRAVTPQDRALGVLKGLVWPAYLVYEGFSALAGRSPTQDLPTPAAE